MTLNSSNQNYAVLLGGKSLENYDKFIKDIDNIYLVNTFSKFFESEKHLNQFKKKNIIHFVNKYGVCSLGRKFYKDLQIKDIQFSIPYDIFDIKLNKSFINYKLMGLNCRFLEKNLLLNNQRDFGQSFKNKFPNTGVLSIYYILSKIRPRNLIIAGLDFYENDYLYTVYDNYPLSKHLNKMKRLNLVDWTVKLFSQQKHTKIVLYTYSKQLKETIISKKIETVIIK